MRLSYHCLGSDCFQAVIHNPGEEGPESPWCAREGSKVAKVSWRGVFTIEAV